MPDKAYRTLRPLGRLFPVYYRFRHKIRDAKLEADRAAGTPRSTGSSRSGKAARTSSAMRSR